MVFFRIDLSSKHGLGHYNRVKSLIKHLNLINYKIVVDKLSNNPYFLSEKKNIISLYGKKNFFLNEEKDANLFLKLINNENPIVVKDSYRLGYKWEKKIYKRCRKVISISDFYEKKNFVDYYINHSPFFYQKNKNILKEIKYNNKKSCKFLLGPDYALFNSVYNKKKKITSDFVFYNGGSGNILVYEKVIKKLYKINNKTNSIVLIVGPFANNYKIVNKKFEKYKNIKILHQPENILHVLAGTKVFISSAGVSIFESSFLKIATLLFKMNSNQNLKDLDYEKLGHYFSLEKKDLNHPDKVATLINLMLKNNDQIKKMMFKTSLNIKDIKKNYLRNLDI